MIRRNNGFTIIELMLAMTFVAVLLILVATSTIFMSSLFTKGVTLKQVNQAGRSISADFTRTISAAGNFNMAYDYIPTQVGGAVVRDTGRLCTHGYTYIWNLASALKLGMGAVYYNGATATTERIRLARVTDPEGSLCLGLTLPNIQKANATELLTQGDRDLVVHSLTITTLSTHDLSRQGLYRMDIVLGTADPGSTVYMANPATSRCMTPAEVKGDNSDKYCSINQFSVIARSGGND